MVINEGTDSCGVREWHLVIQCKPTDCSIEKSGIEVGKSQFLGEEL